MRSADRSLTPLGRRCTHARGRALGTDRSSAGANHRRSSPPVQWRSPDMEASLAPPRGPGGGLSALLDLAVRAPGKVLAAVLALHLAVWTLLPIWVCPNLQLDLAEDLALGREWQLGYWKHPPLPWWIADLVYRLTGTIDSVYVL